jgi:hypothetical protein
MQPVPSFVRALAGFVTSVFLTTALMAALAAA